MGGREGHYSLLYDQWALDELRGAWWVDIGRNGSPLFAEPLRARVVAADPDDAVPDDAALYLLLAGGPVPWLVGFQCEADRMAVATALHRARFGCFADNFVDGRAKVFIEARQAAPRWATAPPGPAADVEAPDAPPSRFFSLSLTSTPLVGDYVMVKRHV